MVAVRSALLVSISTLATLVALPSLAADLSPMPVKAPAAAQSWTGFYLGTYVGSGLVDSQWGSGTGPLAPEDRARPDFVEGVCCRWCAEDITENQRQRRQERQKQIALAKARAGTADA